MMTIKIILLLLLQLSTPGSLYATSLPQVAAAPTPCANFTIGFPYISISDLLQSSNCPLGYYTLIIDIALNNTLIWYNKSCISTSTSNTSFINLDIPLFSTSLQLGSTLHIGYMIHYGQEVPGVLKRNNQKALATAASTQTPTSSISPNTSYCWESDTRTLSVAKTTTQQTLVLTPRDHPKDDLTAQYSVSCNEYYYGEHCDIRCKPNEGGDYFCTTDGRKICALDWYTPESSCLVHCHSQHTDTAGHYQCDPTSGYKICDYGWYNIVQNCTVHCLPTTWTYCDDITGQKICRPPYMNCSACRPPRNATYHCSGNKAICNDHYFGPGCLTYCNPNESPDYHFRCSNNGTKICNRYYYGPLCNCSDGEYGNYACNRTTGQIICDSGYVGEWCDCGIHQYHPAYHCDNTTGKVCNKEYYGPNCTYCAPPIYHDDYYTCDNETGQKLCFNHFFGYSCRDYCRKTRQYDCDPETGERICRPNYYGQCCSVYCETNHTNYECDNETGAVMCKHGWWGDQCQVRVCSEVYFVLTFVFLGVSVLLIIALIVMLSKMFCCKTKGRPRRFLSKVKPRPALPSKERFIEELKHFGSRYSRKTSANVRYTTESLPPSAPPPDPPYVIDPYQEQHYEDPQILLAIPKPAYLQPDGRQLPPIPDSLEPDAPDVVPSSIFGGPRDTSTESEEEERVIMRKLPYCGTLSTTSSRKSNKPPIPPRKSKSFASIESENTGYDSSNNDKRDSMASSIFQWDDPSEHQQQDDTSLSIRDLGTISETF